MIPLVESLPDISKSNSWFERGDRVMTPPTQVLAKGSTQYVDGVAPKFAARAKGARLWDVDGAEYVDYSMAVGPVLLGYAHPEVDAAIRRQLDDGITFSLCHPLEVEVAETLVELIPSAEVVRFGKTGAEAAAAAVRVARAFTGRERVVTCGYHGWHDWYIGTLPRDAGVPEAVKDLVSTFAYNDLASLESALDDQVACVILEPMAFEYPLPGFLEGVVEAAHRVGALVVFDEIWTGFRLAVGGAQELFGVTPDLSVFSKGMANGMPISVVAGRREVMEVLREQAFFFSTFGGEALSLAAAAATIDIVRRHQVPEGLHQFGRGLTGAVNHLAAAHGLGDVVRCSGHPARSVVAFDPKAGDPLLMKSLVQQELIRHRVLWQGFHTLSAAHGESELDQTLTGYDHALEILAAALSDDTVADRLLGSPIEPVFRGTGGFNTKPRSRA